MLETSIDLPVPRDATPSSPDDEVRAEQVRGLYRGLNTSLPVLGLIVLVLVEFLWDAVPHATLLVWAGSVFGFVGVRAILHYLFFKADPRPSEAGRWLTLFNVTLAAHATIIGASAWLLFPQDNPALQLLLFLVMLGILSGGAVTLLFHVPATAIFTALILGPMVLQAAASDTFPDSFAVLAVIYGFVVVLAPRNFNRALVRALRLQAERRIALEEARTAKELAEAASAAKSRFLANVSHELRTPLNAIIGFSDMIRSGVLGSPTNEKYVEYIGHINESGQHLLALVGDMLDLSKIEAGKIDLNEGPVDVGNAVNSCIELVQDEAQEKGVDLKDQVASGLPALYADERRFKQVILNILSNAIKFTPSGGHITVSAIVDVRSGLTVTIADTGIGIDPGDLPEALTPFGQIERSAAPVDGAGLGLPLSKALVDEHGGTLTLESAVGGGTMVRITFPPGRIISHLKEAS